MRLFTGIALPSEITEALSRVIEHLRTTAHLRWSPAYNLHITTKFIGEFPEERLEELITALRGMPAAAPFEVSIKGFGWFPNPHNPRVFFVGIQTGDELRRLAQETENAAAALGVPREDRKFSPHLTLARIKEPKPLDGLRRAVAEMKSDEFGTFRVDRWHLYSSQLGPSGSIYTQLAEFPLAGR